jgi:hypothetical protein
MRFYTAARSAIGLVLVTLVALNPGVALADQWSFVGSRYQAMGGAGVAIADDSTATYWNTANLAFRKGWDVQFGATLNANVENRALESLSALAQEADDIDDSLDTARSDLSPSYAAEEASQIIGFIDDLNGYGSSGEAVHLGLDAILAMRKDSFGGSILSHSVGTLYPSVDLDNLNIAGGVEAFLDDGCCKAPNDTSLADSIAADYPGYWDQTSDPGNLNNYADQLVYEFEQAGADTNDPSTEELILNFADKMTDPDANFAENNTGAILTGLSVQEVGFSYAVILPVPFLEKMPSLAQSILGYVDNKVSVGGQMKYMLGVTFVKATRYDTETGAVVGDFSDFTDNNISHAFGLDLGLSYRPVDWFRFGLAARNVNSPKFDTDSDLFGDLKLDPTVRVGFAWLPVRNLTLALDVDATKNNIRSLPGYRSQLLSIGAEYDIPIFRSIRLAVRAGTYTNFSDTTRDDWSLTGGLGLQAGAFHLDASAGASFDKENIQTGTNEYTDIPTRLNLGLSLRWDVSI